MRAVATDRGRQFCPLAGEKNQSYIHAPEVKSRALAGTREFYERRGPDALRLHMRAMRERQLAWCPREYRGLNATLSRKGVLLPERKRLIAEQADRDAAVARWQIAEFMRRQRERVAREKRDAY